MSVVTDAYDALLAARDTASLVAAEGDSMTVAEVECAIGTARELLDTRIQALEAEYGIRAEPVVAAFRDLAYRLLVLAERVIDAGVPLIEWSVPADLPLAAVAHLLYGDVDRCEELVRLNAITNPNRLSAGRVLRVRAS